MKLGYRAKNEIDIIKHRFKLQPVLEMQYFKIVNKVLLKTYDLILFI